MADFLDIFFNPRYSGRLCNAEASCAPFPLSSLDFILLRLSSCYIAAFLYLNLFLYHFLLCSAAHLLHRKVGYEFEK